MRRIRFLHTSDIHLDTSFSGSGFPSRLGDRKREAIRSSFRQALQTARAESVDFVLIAGDLFEHERVTPDTLEFLKQQFESLVPISVFIAPGNHDPFIAGSPYVTEAWPVNVHIFREERWSSVQLSDIGVRLTGFAYNRTQMPDRLFASLPVLPADLCNVVLAHGSEAGRVPAGKVRHGPFSVDEIASKNVCYCALGHYHQQRAIENGIDATVIWYAGMVEGRGWDEEGDAGFIIADIEGDAVRVRPCPSGQYPLRTLTLECDGFSSREQIVDAVLRQRGTLFDERTILRIELTGYLDSRLDLSFSEMDERLSGAALFLRWEDRTRPALDFEFLAHEKTLRGRFVRNLNERIASAGTDEEIAVLERARLYGLQALAGNEVRLR